MTPRWALLSDVGRLRERNEDFARVVEERGLFAIADGMGGHAGGDVASRVAVDAALDFLASREGTELGALSESILAANRAVLAEAERSSLWGMGTTLTLVQLAGRQLSLAHVGDTRVYVVAPKRLELLTQDHTLVGALVHNGVLSREAARHHPDRHVLVQALGTTETLSPQLREIDVPVGARLLLSSDGLHDIIPEHELLGLASSGDLEDATRALVDGANAAGGPDNITVVLIDP